MYTFRTLSLSLILLCNATPILSMNPESNDAKQEQPARRQEDTNQGPFFPNHWPDDNKTMKPGTLRPWAEIAEIIKKAPSISLRPLPPQDNQGTQSNTTQNNQ